MLQAYRVTSGQPAATYKELKDAPGPADVVRARRTRRGPRSRPMVAARRGARRRGRPQGRAARVPVARRRPRAAERARVVDASPNTTATCPRPARCSTRPPTASSSRRPSSRRRPSVRSATSSGAVSAWTPSSRASATAKCGSTRSFAARSCTISTPSSCASAATRSGGRRWPTRSGSRSAWPRRLADLKKEMPPPSREIEERETRDAPGRPRALRRGRGRLRRRRTRPSASKSRSAAAPAAATEPLADPEPVDHRSWRRPRVHAWPAASTASTSSARPSSRFSTTRPGATTGPAWKGTFAGGRRLQHALYGLAAAELLRRKHKKAKVTAAQYYFPSAKGQRERKRIPMQTRATRWARCSPTCARSSPSGLFVHATDKDDCKLCDFGYACGKSAREAADAKLGDPALAAAS